MSNRDGNEKSGGGGLLLTDGGIRNGSLCDEDKRWKEREGEREGKGVRYREGEEGRDAMIVMLSCVRV